jgi:asparagine synthase (glutamine-hydrolysing)
VSVQIGRWSFDGQAWDDNELEKMRRTLAPYGPDGGSMYSQGGMQILYLPFHTVKEPRYNTQPYISTAGAVFTLDGRLDNRTELLSALGDPLLRDVSDVQITAAAYHKWGALCFARFIGDWAMAIWDCRKHLLLLAKDFIGSKHVYYSFDKQHIAWSTLLDPLVFWAGKPIALCEEYIAGWLSFFPAAHLTPYVGIHSVRPSSYVAFDSRKQTFERYWDFDPSKRIRYTSDAEYEEHFRGVLAQSVRRRLRSDVPVLAELSGGIDSSSIVCMADRVLAEGQSETPRLDTVSYYDDDEPNWNERPYFTAVEAKRGRTGFHIAVNAQHTLQSEFDDNRFAPAPGFGNRISESAIQFSRCVTSQGNRVLLSGIGGDEVTGGVPTPFPGLADLFVKLHFQDIAEQLKQWALEKRVPWFHLLFNTAKCFLPLSFNRTENRKPTWVAKTFVRRNLGAVQGYRARTKLFGSLPSFQENLTTLDGLRRQLSCFAPSCSPLCERRYPYLDRDLLEFLYAIPREQIVRPGQRRSLMRRALKGLVPEKVLNRRRKAYVVRGPMAAISIEWATLVETTDNMLSSSLGIVSSASFVDALEKARVGQEIHVGFLRRTLALEYWLKHLVDRGIVSMNTPPTDFRKRDTMNTITQAWRGRRFHHSKDFS